MDLIGPLPESNGYNCINVIVDRKSKLAHFIQMTTELSSLGQAKIIQDHIFKLHGVPKKIITDRGPQYVSKFMGEFFRLIGITGNPSTAYHLQTDGQTERVNQEVETFLRIWTNNSQNDWNECLSLAEFAYNNKVHSSTGYSPFFLTYGHHPSFTLDPRRYTPVESISSFTNRMKQLQDKATIALTQAASRMKEQYDKKRAESRSFNIGDKVWLEGTNIRTKRPMKKLDDKRFGPFEILEKIGYSAYKLSLPKSWKQYPVFNESLLTPYIAPSFKNQDIPRPPPDIDEEGHPVYEVEEILEKRQRGRGIQYLVKWQGYPHSENTWEPASGLNNAQDAINTFNRLLGRKS